MPLFQQTIHDQLLLQFVITGHVKSLEGNLHITAHAHVLTDDLLPQITITQS